MMKRAVLIALCFLMVMTLAAPAFALSIYATKVEDIVSSPFGIPEGRAAITPEQTEPEDEIIIPILASGFKNGDGADIVWDDVNGYGPTVQQLKSNKIRPVIKNNKSNVIRDYEFVAYTPKPSVPARAALRIRYVKELVSTEERQFNYDIYLYLSNQRYDFELRYDGMLSNPIIEVYTNDYVNLEHGEIAKCYYSTDEIQVHLGHGVDLYSDMVYGEKYYGTAKLEGNTSQNIITSNYPEITSVYSLQTINLKTHGDLVKFRWYEGDTRYVYNIRGEYLGTTADRLPYSRVYYLSRTYIEIDVDADALELELSSDYPEKYPSAAVEQFAQGILEGQEG